jgi:hypothetical protein
MAKAKSGGAAKTSVKKTTTKAKAKAPAAAKTAAKPAAEKKAPVKKTTTQTTATTPKKATTKTRGKSSPEMAAATGMPMIDTNLAAESAAKMLLARPAEATDQAAAPQANKESSTFKNLKEQLAKPKPAALGNLFGHGGGEKKFGGHNFNQQKGHNQTFGGINKAGVPRRTNG